MKLRIIPALALLCLSGGLAFGQTTGGFTLTSNPNPSNLGQAVTLTAGAVAPTTTVTFFDGGQNGTVIGSGNSNSGQVVIIQVSNLTAGTHALIACRPINGVITCTNTVNQVVNTPSAPFTLTSNPNPSSQGQAVTLTASPVPSFTTVTFYDGGSTSGTPLGSASSGTNFNAAVSITVSTLSAGTHTLIACYPNDGPSVCTNTVTQVVSASTTTTLTSSANPASACQSVTFTAKVTANITLPVTGSVTFSDGTTALQTVPLSGGSASLTLTSISIGTHQIQARYNPDPGYNGSSGSLSETVNGTSTITVSTAPNPSNSGQTVTITAAVAATACSGQPPPSTLPTGTVFFFDGPTTNPGNLIGQANVTNGTATLSTSTLAVGSHPLNAQYGGDANYSNSTSNIVTQVVNTGTKTNTATNLTTSANPITTAQSLTLTATVTPSGATGQVQFKDGATVVATGVLSGGTASQTISNIPAGTHPLTAVYVGDNNFNTSTSNTVNEVVNPPGKTNTTTSLSPSANPVTSGQPLTLTASVAPSGATGQVQFSDGSSPLGGPVTLSNGIASLTTSTLSAGAHALTAAYLGDTNFNGSTSNTITETVNPPASSTTTLSVSPNPANAGQTVTLSATVTPANAPGSVQFLDGGTSLGQSNVVNGTATFQTSFPAGTHTLTARYLGDSVNPPSTSNAVTLVVTTFKQNTTTGLSATPNPVNSGQPLTLTASVTPVNATGTPTGTMQFFDGSSPLGGPVTLSNGAASFTTSTLSVGSHNLLSTYSGDANFNSSTGTASVTVTQPTNQSTSISLSVTPLAANPGQAVIMSAVVTPATATGNVTFTDNGSTLSTVTLSNATASFQTTSLAVGSHTIVAVYNGSTTFNSSSSTSVTVVINGTQTQTTLSATPTASTFGQMVTLNASVSATGGGTPSGTVTFSDGNNTLGTVALTGGAASFSTSTLAVGSHSLVASYSGTTTFSASSSLPVSVQVGKASTTTVLTVSPTSSNPGQTVTLTAKVAPTTGSGVLAGTVTFLDGTAAIGSPVSVANGSASTTTSSLSNGSHSLTAVYSGDTNFLASTSPAVTESVGLTQTTTTLAVAPASSSSGQSVTLTATVAPAGATGSVSFLDGAATLGTGALSNGTATFSTSTLSPGPHSLTAVYGGDTRFATSTSTAVTETVGKANSTTVLTATPSASKSGDPVTLRAAVTPATATGIVTFLEGSTTLGTGTLSNGSATFTTSSLLVGSHSLTASYAGDANFNASTSVAVTEVVSAINPPPSNILPTALPNAIVGVPYSQTFTVTGGALPLTWSLASGSVPGLSLSAAGVLSGTPTTATATPISLTVQVKDANGSPAATVLTLTVLPAPAVSISVTQPTTTSDQPAPTVTLGQAFPTALIATFTLSFTPNAASLPTPFNNTAVQFAGGGTTTANINIPPNSTAPVTLPAIQLGSVAGTIIVRLASLTTNGQSVLPANPPSTNITVPRLAPIIVPGSVKIINITSTGFSVFLDASSTPRDLTSASVTFTAASGDQLNGTQFTVSLTTAANTTWFPDTGTNRGVANGGMFSLTMPFTYSGDTTAIGTVLVTLTNSVGTSTGVSGGR